MPQPKAPRTLRVPLFLVRAAVLPQSFDAEAGTFDAVASAGERVLRMGADGEPFWEELEISARALRISFS